MPATPCSPNNVSRTQDGPFLAFQAAEEEYTRYRRKCGKWSSWPWAPCGAWRFARQVTTDRQVDQLLYDQARPAFGTQGITDMLLLIGSYQTVCGVLNAFQIPAPK
jgi:hypothetical protein